jgi:acetylornithine deacetylase
MISEVENKVLDLIDGNRNELIALLQKLVQFKTITPQDDTRVEHSEFADHQEFIRGILDKMNFDLETWEADATKLDRFPGSGVYPERDLSNMPIVSGKLPGSGNGRSLILNGHYDVVPIGLIENWQFDPFKGEIVDGRMYGRGTCDMKGGIAAMIQALKAIQDVGIALGGDITIEIVPDEEATSMGTLACCQKGYTADAALIPEPTDMKVLVAMRGGMGGKLTVYGRAGHAEMTQPHWTEGGAINAISKAVKFIHAFEDMTEEWRTRPDKQHKLLDPDIITPTVIKGGEWSVTYPEKVEIVFDSMFLPGTMDKIKEIEAHIDRVAALDPWMRENPPKLDIDSWLYGAEVDENEPIVQMGLKVLADMGLEAGLTGFGSLTDAIHLINYSKIPTISIGPGSKPAHEADEYVEIEELVDTAKALALTIMRWCK